jgi:hypothetical protein
MCFVAFACGWGGLIMYPNIFLFLLLFFIPFIEYLCDSFFSFIVVKVGILLLALFHFHWGSSSSRRVKELVRQTA